MRKVDCVELLIEELGSATQIIETLMTLNDSRELQQYRLILNDEAMALLTYCKASLEVCFDAILEADLY